MEGIEELEHENLVTLDSTVQYSMYEYCTATVTFSYGDLDYF